MNKLKICFLVFGILFVSSSVLVEASNTNPKIILNGQEEITLVKGNKYQEQGVVVKGDDILKVETTGTVIENVTGEYVITYTATDTAGHLSTMTRTIKVIDQPNILSENYVPQMNDTILESEDNGAVLGVNKYIFSQKLSFGSRNNEVTELHKKLIADGYLKIASPTGYFGSQTLKAVKDFQTANTLVSDGIVGPKTREVLNK